MAEPFNILSLTVLPFLSHGGGEQELTPEENFQEMRPESAGDND
jgi:hypothetical protein